MLGQDHARLIVEIFRKILTMIDNILDDESEGLGQRFDEINELLKQTVEIRKTMMSELQETGSMLVNREGFFRYLTKLSDFSDFIEEIGFWLLRIKEEKWKIPGNIGNNLKKLFTKAFDTLMKLRENLTILGYSPNRAMMMTPEVDAEKLKIFSIYEKIDFEIISSTMDLPMILILRDLNKTVKKLIHSSNQAAEIIWTLAL